MKKYLRKALEVQAFKYEVGKGMEDGFELLTKVITNGWITPSNLIEITQPDGKIVCPFIENKRGRLFIRNGDYIIIEGDNEKHVCGGEKFHNRFEDIE